MTMYGQAALTILGLRWGRAGVQVVVSLCALHWSRRWDSL